MTYFSVQYFIIWERDGKGRGKTEKGEGGERERGRQRKGISRTNAAERCGFKYIYVEAEMDISAGSVPAGPNLTGGMNPGMNTTIYTEDMKSKCVRNSIRNI